MVRFLLVAVGFFAGLFFYRFYVRWRIYRWLKEHRPLQGSESFGALLPRFSFLLKKLHREIEEKENMLRIYQGMVASLEDAIVQLPVPVILVDEQGRVTRVNDSASEWFALSKPVTESQSLFVWMLSTNPEWQDFVREMLQNENKSQLLHFLIHDLIYPDQRVECVVLPWIHEYERYFIMVLFDETAHAHHERYKTEVLDLIIHQIRTPLTALSGALELLDRGEKFFPETKNIIERNIGKLMAFLSRLELLYEVQSPVQGPFEDIRLDEVLNQVIDDMRTTYQDKRVKLEVKLIPVSFNGDPSLIPILFENILDNAFKFSPEDGTVRVHMLQSNDDTIVFIEDEGPGIPLKEIPHVFERFYRGEFAKTHHLPGNGLGLSIVKHITKMHAIEIEIEPSSHGTRVVLTFPRTTFQES